jgi:hypothetical protein
MHKRPATVPNGPSDIATFAASNQTAISVSSATEVNEIDFAAGSSTFSFVSGQGGEKQPIDVVSPTTPYRNFLRVRLN